MSAAQRARLLGSAALLVSSDLAQRIWWRLGLPGSRPGEIDLERWSPPDTPAASEAASLLEEVSSAPMVGHSLRSYYFSALMYELSGITQAIDKEALYVAAALHDVGLFEREPPPGQHCFTVASAREARRIATAAGWDQSRQDRMAAAITANPNGIVPIARFGLEAHIFTIGGLVEVLAQEWKIHPDNLRTILARHPRDGYAHDALRLVHREIATPYLSAPRWRIWTVPAFIPDREEQGAGGT